MTKTSSRSHSVRLSAALTAPPSIVPIGNDRLALPHHAQAARVAGRVRVSPAVADLIASLAWGAKQRDDNLMLVTVTTARVAAYTEAC